MDIFQYKVTNKINIQFLLIDFFSTWYQRLPLLEFFIFFRTLFIIFLYKFARNIHIKSLTNTRKILIMNDSF